MKFESGYHVPEAVVTEAYVANNVVNLQRLIDEDVSAWEHVLTAPRVERNNIEGYIQRLEGMRQTVAEMIARYGVVQPIDHAFVEEVGQYLDSAEACADLYGEPQYEAENMQEIIDGLARRNAAAAAENAGWADSAGEAVA